MPHQGTDQLHASLESHEPPLTLIQRVGLGVAAFVLGSVLTALGFFVLSESSPLLVEEGIVFGAILVSGLLVYYFLLKPYQLSRQVHAKKLAELFQYTNAILDSMANGVLVIDARGRIQSLNRAVLELTGYLESELRHREVASLFLMQGDDNAYAQAPEQITRMLQLGVSNEREFLLVAKNGAMIPVQVTSSVLRFDKGNVKENIIILNDITERREIEISLFNYQHNLQEMVNQRTEKLKSAMEAANAANQTKNEFLANMSHEIRSPMTAIIGMTDLVLHSQLTTDQREKLNIVQNAAHNLLNLINSILDLSKIEAGQLMLERISFSIGVAVENVCELLAIKAHEKGLELFCYLAPDTPERVIGDPNRLSQILMNLITNAIKFTDSGEVTVLVQHADHQHAAATINPEVHSDHVDLIFSVADTGVGIPENRQQHVFERFTQEDGSTTRKYGGTGLGLTICKVLSELMGGTIQVESEVDEGSVFHVTLPFGSTLRPQVDTDLSLDSHVDSLTKKALVGVRILVVDSNPTGRTIVAEILQGFGAIVGEAETLVTIVTVLEKARDQNRPWDLLLIDQKVVETYGMELAELKNHAGWGGKAALLLISNARFADFVVMNEFVQSISIRKPVKRFALLRSLKALLEGRSLESHYAEDGFLEESSVTPLKILLAEDLEENRKLAASILIKVGHEVTQAKDGQEALDRMAGGMVFDLVLTDLHMPSMDGYELTRRIREGQGQHALVPIVAVTARALPGEKALCLASGMDEFLVKPYRPVDLLNVVSRAALKRRSKQHKIEAKPSVSVLQSGDDSVLFATSSSQFLTDYAQFLALLKTALAEKNIKRAREQIEGIKKQAIALGAQKLKSKAVRLGVAVRAEEWLKVNKLIKELEIELLNVQDVLMETRSPIMPDSSENR